MASEPNPVAAAASVGPYGTGIDLTYGQQSPATSFKGAARRSQPVAARPARDISAEAGDVCGPASSLGSDGDDRRCESGKFAVSFESWRLPSPLIRWSW